jgi:hypothetical protein
MAETKWGSASSTTVERESRKILRTIEGAAPGKDEITHTINIANLALRERDLVALLRAVRAKAPDTQCYAERTPAKFVDTGLRAGYVESSPHDYTIHLERVPPATRHSEAETAVRDACLLREPPSTVLENQSPLSVFYRTPMALIALVAVIATLCGISSFAELFRQAEAMKVDQQVAATMCMIAMSMCCMCSTVMVGAGVHGAHAASSAKMRRDSTNPAVVAWAHEMLRVVA